MPETDTYREIAARLGWGYVPKVEGVTVEILRPDHDPTTYYCIDAHPIIRDRAAEALDKSGHAIQRRFSVHPLTGDEHDVYFVLHYPNCMMPRVLRDAEGVRIAERGPALLAALDLAGIGAKP